MNTNAKEKNEIKPSFIVNIRKYLKERWRYSLIFIFLVIAYILLPWNDVYNDVYNAAIKTINLFGEKLPEIIKKIHWFLYISIILAVGIWQYHWVWYFLRRKLVSFLLIGGLLFVPLLGYLTSVSENWRFIMMVAAGWIILEILAYPKYSPAEKKMEQGFDKALQRLEQDRFERKYFVRQALDVAEKTRFEKIALVGPWGCGKTSCLNFMAEYACDRKMAVVNFSPWKYIEKDEMWKAFIQAMDAGMAEYQGVPFGPLQQNRIFRWLNNLIRKLAGLHEVGLLFETLLAAKIEGKLPETRKHVERVIKKELQGKKLLVLIDDLDRCLPEVTYDIFTTVHEILNITGCVFIFALDWDNTCRIMRLKNKIMKPEDFLEKIFQLKIQVPEPRREHRAMFLEDVLNNSFCQNVQDEIVLGLQDDLPSNPRALKLYLFEINAFEAIMSGRYDTEDFNWPAMYLASLLKRKYAEIIKVIREGSKFNLWGDSEDENNEEKRKLVEAHLSDEEKITKFEALMKRFLNEAQYNMFRGLGRIIHEMDTSARMRIYNPEYYFRVLDFPEVLTGKEYRGWRKSANDNRAKLVDKLMDGKEPIMRRREFLFMLMDERLNLLDKAADVPDGNERDSFLRKCKNLTQICLKIVGSESLHDNKIPLFDFNVFENWLNGCEKYALWKEELYIKYGELRKQEKELAGVLTRNCKHMASEILAKSRIFTRNRLSTESEGDFQATADELREELKKALANQLLNGFSANGFIKHYRDNNGFESEKKSLVEKNDYFYCDENILRLQALAEKAGADPAINDNFLNLILMLFYGIPGLGITADTIFQDDIIREMIWQGATARILNNRDIGQLLGDRKKHLQTKGISDKHYLPIPNWVEKTYSTLFEQYKK